METSQKDAAFGIFTDGDSAAIADGSSFWQKQITQLFVVDLDIRLASGISRGGRWKMYLHVSGLELPVLLRIQFPKTCGRAHGVSLRSPEAR